MISIFKNRSDYVFVVESIDTPDKNTVEKLCWLFGNATLIKETSVNGYFIGPRKEMITPWSTNAVEITQNMGIGSIKRIEQFFGVPDKSAEYDPMLQKIYEGIDQNIFTINHQPEPVLFIDNIATYNQKEGLALNEEEIKYLDELSSKLGRKLTDSEIFGFSQVNSEHCRHKIFNGTFIIDGKEMDKSLFQLIKQTTISNPNRVVSAYKDNCAFVRWACY